ncbi:MAG: hypothetical protein VKJ06_08920 [Vampirovibrionales bacterium]|nr:hypothetical protein [Vampirovibrionales bacterium]
MRKRYGRRSSRSSAASFFRLFALQPWLQYVGVVAFALLFAALVFSGFLLFRLSDQEDMLSRGRRYLAEEKSAWAAKTLRALVNRYPNSYDGHLYLGQAYLALEEPQKAEQQFRLAAALQAKGDAKNDLGVRIALAKLSVAKKEFSKAEESLLETREQAPQNPDLKQALYELYEAWGDDLTHAGTQSAVSENLDPAVEAYQKALTYVSDYASEQTVKHKLSGTIHRQVAFLLQDLPNTTGSQTGRKKSVKLGPTLKNKVTQAIALLKTSLASEYAPKTLIEIGRLYELLEEPEIALSWYRKAFDVNPSSISLKLSNLLLQQAEAYDKRGKTELASAYRKESKQIAEKANIPLESLYPIDFAETQLGWEDLDIQAGIVTPRISGIIINRGERPLEVLEVKAAFYSADKLLGSTIETVISPQKPLTGDKSNKNNDDDDKTVMSRAFEIALPRPVNLNLLSNGQLQAKVSIALSEGQDAVWVVKAIKETRIPNSLLYPQPEPEPEASVGDETDASTDPSDASPFDTRR